MQTIEILETTRKLAADGDMKGAQDFLVAHFKELPEDLQGDFLIQFLKDAGSANKLKNAVADVREAAVEVIELIEEGEETLKKVGAGGEGQK